MENTNVLYFEGAGMNFHSEEQTGKSDVGNFRIRTSFINNDGKQIYLEMGNGNVYDKKGKVIDRFSLYIDFCFEVPEDKNEHIQYNAIYNKSKEHLVTRELDYTKDNIVNWINDNLNCNFDTIEVLDRFYGYHVHGGNNVYNLMENVELNHERAILRNEAYDKIDKEYKIALGEKYSVIGVNEMNDDNIIIKCHASGQKLEKAKLERIVRVPIATV